MMNLRTWKVFAYYEVANGWPTSSVQRDQPSQQGHFSAASAAMHLRSPSEYLI